MLVPELLLALVLELELLLQPLLALGLAQALAWN